MVDSTVVADVVYHSVNVPTGQENTSNSVHSMLGPRRYVADDQLQWNKHAASCDNSM
jgi:hypothetical protein